jgi:hypothetical protein
MGLIEDAFKGWTGLAVGLGVAYAAPTFAPALGSVVRPLAKGVIKTGLVIAQSVREYAAEASDELGDIDAEARAENGVSRRGSTSARTARAEANDGQSRRRAARRRKA